MDPPPPCIHDPGALLGQLDRSKSTTYSLPLKIRERSVKLITRSMHSRALVACFQHLVQWRLRVVQIRRDKAAASLLPCSLAPELPSPAPVSFAQTRLWLTLTLRRGGG